jgi:hypothetical protein
MKRLPILTAACAATLLAGCAAPALLPAQPGNAAATARSDAAALPSCKGQKTTKDYAQSQLEALDPKGGTACVPKFKNWGWSIKYPEFTGSSVKATLISSTTAYNPALFPPYSSGVFYIQIQFSGSVRFGSTIPAGASLASSALKPKKPYTIEASEPLGSLWQILPECYTVATTGKYGPQIGGLGVPMKNYMMSAVVVSIYEGKLTTNKC